MPRARHLLAVALCFAAAITALAQAQKRSITEKDIFQFNWIGDPQISPDGSRVAFVKVTVDEKKTGYDTCIWSVGTRGDEQPRRMTDGKHDSGPRWSPDGKWLVFVRAPEPSAAAAGAGPGGPGGAGARPPSAQLYLLPVSGGGESWKITDLPRGAGDGVARKEDAPPQQWIGGGTTGQNNKKKKPRQQKKNPKGSPTQNLKPSPTKKKRRGLKRPPPQPRPLTPPTPRFLFCAVW